MIARTFYRVRLHCPLTTYIATRYQMNVQLQIHFHAYAAQDSWSAASIFRLELECQLSCSCWNWNAELECQANVALQFLCEYEWFLIWCGAWSCHVPLPFLCVSWGPREAQTSRSENICKSKSGHSDVIVLPPLVLGGRDFLHVHTHIQYRIGMYVCLHVRSIAKHMVVSPSPVYGYVNVRNMHICVYVFMHIYMWQFS